MRRKTLDALLSAAGLVVAAVLIIAGSLLAWGHNFTSHEVHSQLAAQQIFFPAKGSPALTSPEIGPYLNQYAGQQLTTGPQAKAFADHFIAVHLKEASGGQTYSQLSAQAQKAPTDTKLAGEVATAFKGETLRGMLLNAYAFDTMGRLALIGSIVAFAGAGFMLILSILGLWHGRRVSPDTVVRGTRPSPATV
jgi:hypothetical protein